MSLLLYTPFIHKDKSIHVKVCPHYNISNIIFPLVELLDQSAELLHNMTVHFETLDTCFCYGYCGCSVCIYVSILSH